MERVLGFYESYCKYLYESYCGDGTVLTIAHVSGKLAPSVVLNGLNQLQHRHPLLQAVVSMVSPNENIFVFSAYSKLSLLERLSSIPLEIVKRSSSDDWMLVAEKILSEPIECYSKYLWRFVYLCCDEGDEGELFLYSRHDISDARSTNHLMNDLITYCSNFIDGNEMELPSLPVLPSIERQLLRGKNKDVSVFQVASETNCTGVDAQIVPEMAVNDWPYLAYSEVNTRKPICVFYKLGEHEFNRIKKATKGHDVTINSALAVALMLAQKTVYCPSDEVKVRINTAISLREYCDPVLSYEHFGCYVMNVSTDHLLFPLTDFWSLSKAYGHELLKSIEEAKLRDFLPTSCDYQEVISAVDSDALMVANKKAFVTPMITNSGLLPFSRTHKSLSLRGLYVGTKQVFGDCGMVLSTLTLNGEMFFMFSGCEPLLNKERMNQIVGNLFSILLKESDIV